MAKISIWTISKIVTDIKTKPLFSKIHAGFKQNRKNNKKIKCVFESIKISCYSNVKKYLDNQNFMQKKT